MNRTVFNQPTSSESGKIIVFQRPLFNQRFNIPLLGLTLPSRAFFQCPAARAADKQSETAYDGNSFATHARFPRHRHQPPHKRRSRQAAMARFTPILYPQDLPSRAAYPIWVCGTRCSPASSTGSLHLPRSPRRKAISQTECARGTSICRSRNRWKDFLRYARFQPRTV